MKLDAQWIVGFVDGEGSFVIALSKPRDGHKNFQLHPELTVTQHVQDIQVLYALKEYFGCGYVFEPKGDNTVAYWRVAKLRHLIDLVIPFFEKHQLKTKRAIEFQRFRRVCLWMEQKIHLSCPEGYEKCVSLTKHLRIKYHPNQTVDEGRVQLLPTDTQSCSAYAEASMAIPQRALC